MMTERPFHGDRRRPPTPSWNGLSRKRSSSRVAVSTDTTAPISRAWTTARSPLSAKKSMKMKMTPAEKNRTHHNGARDHADGAVDAVAAGLLPGRRLVEPLAVGRLLGRGAGLDRPERAEELDPQGFSCFAQGAVLHAVPLHAGHRAGVADQLRPVSSADTSGGKSWAVSTCWATRAPPTPHRPGPSRSW